MKAEILRALIERACQEEIGLVVKTNSQKQMQLDLCNALDGADVRACIGSLEDHVFLVRKSVELD